MVPCTSGSSENESVFAAWCGLNKTEAEGVVQRLGSTGISSVILKSGEVWGENHSLLTVSTLTRTRSTSWLCLPREPTAQPTRLPPAEPKEEICRPPR